eukprot:2652370-Prorocentrum_lima.AAC.1
MDTGHHIFPSPQARKSPREITGSLQTASKITGHCVGVIPRRIRFIAHDVHLRVEISDAKDEEDWGG